MVGDAPNPDWHQALQPSCVPAVPFLGIWKWTGNGAANVLVVLAQESWARRCLSQLLAPAGTSVPCQVTRLSRWVQILTKVRLGSALHVRLHSNMSTRRAVTRPVSPNPGLQLPPALTHDEDGSPVTLA